ncbi:MAG: anion permease [Deltaproteobacteria bacterium]|nr:anion permease [Deltaproteobacteria bacterium]
MWQLVSGVFLGWSLGSNDASNVFGTAVASRMVRFWTAAVLCAVFVFLGAVFQGGEGMATYHHMAASGSMNVAFVVALSAALTVTLMTYWGLPVSTSQAVVGSMVLVGLVKGSLEMGPLYKVLACWVATPVGSMLIAIILYFLLGKIMNLWDSNMFVYDRNLRIGLIVAGSYGAYALGANNVANVTGVFVGKGMLTPFWACVIGGLSIGLGVLTYSHNVMMTVGRGLVKLDAFSAFIVVLSEAITVHMFAYVGVPVSTSQAVVGAVLGIGVIKGVKTVNFKTLARIVFGWIGTPAISFGGAWVLYRLFELAGLV